MKKLAIVLFVVLCTLSLFGANATPVAINTTTVTGQVATVNTGTVHGLVVGQGACLSAPSSVCGVVQTTPTTQQYTLLVGGTAPAPCSASCGSSSPAPQIAVLQTVAISQASVQVSYVLWLTTQLGCLSSASSAWKPGAGSVGASTALLNAINAGLFIENQRTITVPSNTSLIQLQQQLQNDYVQQQQALSTNVQPCALYGQIFDGTGWAKQ